MMQQQQLNLGTSTRKGCLIGDGARDIYSPLHCLGGHLSLHPRAIGVRSESKVDAGMLVQELPTHILIFFLSGQISQMATAGGCSIWLSSKLHLRFLLYGLWIKTSEIPCWRWGRGDSMVIYPAKDRNIAYLAGWTSIDQGGVGPAVWGKTRSADSV